MTNLYKIVMKLNGPIQPTGEHGVDEDRFKNLQSLTAVLDDLLYDIRQASRTKRNLQASMKKIGIYAHNFLVNMADEYAGEEVCDD